MIIFCFPSHIYVWISERTLVDRPALALLPVVQGLQPVAVRGLCIPPPEVKFQRPLGLRPLQLHLRLLQRAHQALMTG